MEKLNMEDPEESLGAGSGGGPDEGGTTKTFDGQYRIVANQMDLVVRPPLPPADQQPFKISLLAAGMGPDGHIEMRGSAGVRITTGPPPLPPTGSDSTAGVEIMTGEAHSVKIHRGLIDGVDQKIEMTPGAILVDAGAGTITIQSLTSITLSVAGGLSTIKLTPAGIVIQGLLVEIN